MAGEIFKLVGKIALEGQQGVSKGLEVVSKGAKATAKVLDDTGKNMQNFGKKMGDVGETLTKYVSAPLTAVGVAGIAMSNSFEDSSAKMQAALRLTEDQANKFAQVGREVLKNGWGENLDEVTNSIIAVKQQLGDLPDDQLQSVTEKAIMLEKTFGMDMNESLRGVNALMTAYGMTAEEALDYMTVGAQNGLDKTGELGDNLAEYATLFQENGYSANEMFAILQSGLDGGAYNLDKVNDLVKEFGVRMSDGTVIGALDDMGGGWAELSKQIQEGGLSNKEAFQLVAKEISGLGTEQEKAAAVSAIFGSMGEDAGFKVIEAMGGANNTLQETSAMYGNVTGAANEAIDVQSTFSSKLAGLKVAALEALTPIGDNLKLIAGEFLDKVVPAIEQATEKFKSMSPEAQKNVTQFGLIAAALPPILVVGGKVIGVLGGVVSAVGGIGSAVSGASGVAGAALGALSTPVLAIIAVVAALVAGLVVAYNTSEEFRNKVNDAFQSIMDKVTPILDTIKNFALDVFNQIKGWWDTNGAQFMEAVSNVWNGILAAIQFVASGIITFLKPCIEMAIDLFALFVDMVLPQIQFFIDTILNIFKIFASVFTGDWAGVWDAVKSIFTDFVDMVVTIFTNFLNSDLIQNLLGFVATVLTTIGQFFLDVLAALGQFVINVVVAIAKLFADIIVGVGKFILDVITAIGKFFADIIGAVVGFIADILGKIAQFFIDLLSPVVAFFADIAVKLAKFVADVVNAVVALIVILIATVVNFIADVIGKIIAFWADILGKLIAFIQEILAKVKQFFIDLLSPVVEFIADVINKVVEFFADIIGKVVEFVASVINKVVEFVQGVIEKIRELVDTVVNFFKELNDAVMNIIGAVAEFFVNTFNTIKDTVIGVVQYMVDNLVSRFTWLFEQAMGIITPLIDGIIGAFNTAKDMVTGAVDTLKNGVVNTFNAMKDIVTGIFEAVKNAIITPIEIARDVVGNIVDAIKGFFDFEIKLPRIKLPHFAIQPKGWSIGDLLHGEIPSLDVDWYANGGVFSNPSIIGVGEQSGVSEAVIPLRNDVYSEIGEGIRRAMGRSGETGSGETPIVNNHILVNIDGEEVAAVVEPKVSELQGDKSDADGIRGGTRL